MPAIRASCASYGARKCAGVMLWYCSIRRPGSAANSAVIAEGAANWSSVTSPRRARGSVHGSTSPSRLSSIVMAKISDVWPHERNRSRTPRV